MSKDICEPLVLSAQNGTILTKWQQEAGPTSILREVLKNAIESGATEIKFTPEWIMARRTLAQGKRVDKLAVQDNGGGMLVKDLIRFMQGLGVSGKPTGVDLNYGIGLKAVSLASNPHGVVVLSWANDEGNKVRLFLDSRGSFGLYRWPENNYELSAPTTEEEDAEYKPADGHGTVVIFMGASEDQDTFPLPGISRPRHMTRFLNTRFFEFDPKIWVQIYEPGPKTEIPKESWATCDAEGHNKESGLGQMRSIRGSKYHFDLYKTPTDGYFNVRLSHGNMHVWIHEPDKGTDLCMGSGRSALLYRNELFDESHKGHNLTLCGLTMKEVRDRVVLVYEPDEHLVQMDMMRVHLNFLDPEVAEHSNWQEWGAEFRAQMPEMLVNMLKACTLPYNQNKLQEKVNQMCLELRDLLDWDRFPKGGTPKRPQNPPKTGQKRNPPQGGSHGSTFPSIEPVDELFRSDEDPALVPALWTGKVIQVNTNHPQIIDLGDQFIRDFQLTTATDEQIVRDTVFEIIGMKLVETVVTAKALQKQAVSYAHHLVTPDALSAVLCGKLSLHRQIKSALASRFGRNTNPTTP